jgi:hypothetical protein
MQLKLTRGQAEKKGLLGSKVMFQISFRVELTPEEQEVVRKYKANREVLAQVPPIEWGNSVGATKAVDAMRKLGHGQIRNLTIRDFIAGQTFEYPDVLLMNAIEAEVKQGCATFKAYLDEVSGGGKEEAIEF